METDRDLSAIVADFFASTRYEMLSQDAIDGAKKGIADLLGVCIAASGKEPAVRAVVDFVRTSGGQPEATIFAFGGKVPAMMAAFANGAMAHCLDYDDQTPWGQHSGMTLMPAVFAAAERRGGVSGRDMISAIAAGQDFFNRMRLAVDWRKDWMFSSIVGIFGAAAAAAKILGLQSEGIARAMGIAIMQCSGTTEVINSTGGDLRALYAGFPAKGATLAALLADRNISGVPRVMEGAYGLLPLYFGDRYDRSQILDGLGERYTGGLTLHKRWPAVGTAHSHIYATIKLMAENKLSHTDIAELRMYVGDYHQLMSAPLEARRAPRTLVDAKFSLPFLVAIAAVRGDVRLKDFTDEALHDPDILAFAQKIVPVPDPALDWKLELPAGKVVIVTPDGRVLEQIGTDLPGSLANPMSWEDIMRKFSDCAESAITPWPADKIAKAQEMASRLDKLDDATALMRLAGS